ncbi:MAG TPA: hypothetical protein DEB39_13120 [Planctomycetaceae bacterium]|nr:hypothetical protein [Planctomycetaceae bacterium]
MKRRRLFALALVLLLLVPAGCSGKVHLEGKVTFTDGTPLDLGTVCFETDNFLARGTIRPDGTYDVGSLSDNDGLPPGTYNVYVTGTEKEVARDKDDYPVFTPTVDPKYAGAKTSGLTVTVPAATGAFDFQVEPYVPPKKTAR